MTASGLAGLTLMLLGLGGVIAFELSDRPVPQGSTVAVPSPMAGVANRSRPVSPPEDTDASLSEILARPVFSPDRRPVSQTAKTVSGLSRLTGIIVSGSRKVAIFAGPSGDHPVVAQEGSHINAYEVKEINGSGVTVVGPAGTMVVTPLFDPTQPQVPKQPSRAFAKPVPTQK